MWSKFFHIAIYEHTAHSGIHICIKNKYLLSIQQPAMESELAFKLCNHGNLLLWGKSI